MGTLFVASKKWAIATLACHKIRIDDFCMTEKRASMIFLHDGIHARNILSFRCTQKRVTAMSRTPKRISHGFLHDEERRKACFVVDKTGAVANSCGRKFTRMGVCILEIMHK